MDALLNFVVLCRAWKRPDVVVAAKPGEVRHERNHLPAEEERERSAPVGVFLQTMWARDRWLRRVPIKLEALAGEAGIEGQARQSVDLVLSVGSRVPPGFYVAHRQLTAIRIQITG